MKKIEKIKYPIEFNGKSYKEKDCHLVYSFFVSLINENIDDMVRWKEPLDEAYENFTEIINDDMSISIREYLKDDQTLEVYGNIFPDGKLVLKNDRNIFRFVDNIERDLKRENYFGEEEFYKFLINSQGNKNHSYSDLFKLVFTDLSLLYSNNKDSFYISVGDNISVFEDGTCIFDKEGYEEDADLYPVHFDGKLLHERDCSDVFTSFYTCIEALRPDGSVYAYEGMVVFPNGDIEND